MKGVLEMNVPSNAVASAVDVVFNLSIIGDSG